MIGFRLIERICMGVNIAVKPANGRVLWLRDAKSHDIKVYQIKKFDERWYRHLATITTSPVVMPELPIKIPKYGALRFSLKSSRVHVHLKPVPFHDRRSLYRCDSIAKLTRFIQLEFRHVVVVHICSAAIDIATIQGTINVSSIHVFHKDTSVSAWQDFFNNAIKILIKDVLNWI